MSLDLTVDEMFNLVKKPSKNGGKLIVMKVAPAHFRDIPYAVAERGIEMIEQGEEITKVIDYVFAAFNIYRGTVKSEFLAPLHKVKTDYRNEIKDIYEWPRPSMFGWDNVEDVVKYGELMYGNPTSRPVITSDEGNKVKETYLTLDSGGEVGSRSEKYREKINLRDSAKNIFKYNIESQWKIGFIAQQAWQNICLNKYVIWLQSMPKHIKKGKMSEADVKIIVNNYFNDVLKENEKDFLETHMIGRPKHFYEKNNANLILRTFMQSG